MIDHLTQCASLKALNEALESAQSPKLFLIDIRQFKAFNIRYGDEGGNAILRALASTLQHFCHEQEMRLFRVRDDQFALLIDCPFELSKMERLIFALSDVLKNIAIDYHDETITLETAIGISFDHFNALEKAQKALQVAKAEQQPFVTFSEFANVLLSENEEAIETAIKEAIAQEKLVFHLQAVVNVFNQPFYHELLLRLADTQTLQSPKLFLKIAKERGFYGELFHSIVQKAKGLAEELSTPVALNLFDTDLLDETLFSELLNLPLDNVFLEVHYYHVASPQALNQAFQRLKEQGATIILDSVMEKESVVGFDAHLIDYIKLHGNLMRDFTLSPQTKELCEALVSYAQTHDIQVIASQLNAPLAKEKAQELECDLFQGHMIEQPHVLA